MINKTSAVSFITDRADLTGSRADIRECSGQTIRRILRFRLTINVCDVSGWLYFCRIVTSGILFSLLATILAGKSQAQTPAPKLTLDLRQYGFIVNDAIQNNTTLGFITPGKIAIHIDQCQVPSECKNRLLIIDIKRKVVDRVADLPFPTRFTGTGKILYFSPNRLDLYSSDLKPLRSYTPQENRHLDFAARSGMVQLSPDRLKISIASGQGSSQILDTENLDLLQNVKGTILALSQNRWFVRKGESTSLVEQISADHTTSDSRSVGSDRCPELPAYLDSTLVLIQNCDGEMNVIDGSGRVRYSIGKRLGSLAVVPDIAGDRFATELYVSKGSWNGTAQYSKVIVRVFETASGREIFHLEETPSEQEPTFSHYVAIAPNGSKLAMIFGGVLRIYDLEAMPSFGTVTSPTQRDSSESGNNAASAIVRR